MTMRLRVLTATLALAVAAAGVAVAGSGRHAKSRTALKVRRCETGDDASKRLATFYGRMKSVPHARRMMMRFRLIDRSFSGSALVDGPPELRRWRRSRRGVRKFGYKQTVTGLERGHTYVARVRFRWVGRHGRRVATARRTSAECRQDGDLPNLAIKQITARSGLAEGTELYSIDVVNRGGAAAHSAEVELIVDSAEADTAEISDLGPGEKATVEISGPACEARVRAVVDPDDQIAETTDDDNTRAQRCPAVAR